MDEKKKELINGIFENLTDEQKEKAKSCKTTNELMELAGEWGVELPDEVLDAVAGGCSGCPEKTIPVSEFFRVGYCPF